MLGRESPAYAFFSNFEIYSEGENGDIVNDAIFRRNVEIEDKYNVKITQELFDSPHGQLEKCILANDDLYDLAFIESGNIGSLARQGYFYNMNNVAYIDFTKPWWNSGLNDTLSFRDKLFFTSSDFALRDKSRIYIGAYNRDMCKELNLEDPIQLVRDGKWTFGKLNEYVKAAANDLNGNGEIDYTDRFGIGEGSYDSLHMYVVSAGNMMVKKDTSGELVLSMNNERTVKAVETIFEMLSAPGNCICSPDWEGKVDFDYWSTHTGAFKEGRVLFTSSMPQALSGYSADCSFDYGIIPIPKLDEEQENYCTMAERFSMLFAIPISTPDPDFSGFMLEVLSAKSTDTSLNAYLEVSCKTKHIYDETSAEMLDLIFENIRYDLGLLYNIGGLFNIYTGIFSSKNNNFSSAYASKESAAIQDLNKLIEDLSAIE